MNLKKPKFWDNKNPNFIAFLLYPISLLILIYNFLRKKNNSKNFNIKTICVGNIYLGGTGKTSLSLKINSILKKKNIKSCFIKKYYKNQIDEQKILKENGKLFLENRRVKALEKAENEGYEVAIFDDGLQDKSIKYDLRFVCFNNINWKGNGMTIPSGPLRENITNLKNYEHIFLNGNLEDIENLQSEIKEINPNMKIYIGKYVPQNLHEFDKKDRYLVFSGIGNHDTFISMLRKNDFNIIKDFEFPDHYEYKKKDIDFMIYEARKNNCKLLTTEKDKHRLNDIYNNEVKIIKSELQIINEDNLIKTLI